MLAESTITSLVRDSNTASNLDTSAVCDKNESNQYIFFFFFEKQNQKPEAMTCKYVASLSPSVQKEFSIYLPTVTFHKCRIASTIFLAFLTP